jgi:hypothetical protein
MKRKLHERKKCFRKKNKTWSKLERWMLLKNIFLYKPCWRKQKLIKDLDLNANFKKFLHTEKKNGGGLVDIHF